MAGGRISTPVELKSVHQAAPWPSITPVPLKVTFVRLEP